MSEDRERDNSIGIIWTSTMKIVDGRGPSNETDVIWASTAKALGAGKFRIADPKTVKVEVMRRVRIRNQVIFAEGDAEQEIFNLATAVKRKGRREPPKIAEVCLAAFLNGAKGDALLGDLSERFEQDCERFGTGRARRLYWSRTIRSLWPLMRRGAARAIKWGIVVDSVRRFFTGG